MRRRGWLVGAAAVLGLVGGASAAAAHPQGELSVSTYDGVVVGTDVTTVDHVEDLAEIPALAAVRSADRDGDGRLAAAEARVWASERCAQAARRVVLARDGVAQPWRLRSASATQRPGTAGLPLLRVECRLESRRAVDGATRLSLVTEPVTDVGWHEITLAGDGTVVRGSTAPGRTVSARLTDYPAGQTRDDTAAEAVVAPGGTPLRASTDTATRAGGGVLAPLQARLDDAIGRDGPLGIGLLAGVLAVSAALGAAHAVAPGHGKTVIAAALVASGPGRDRDRGRRLREALAVGAAVTLAHTSSVLVVAALLTAAAATLSGRVLGAFEVAAGALVLALGVALLRGAARHGHAHNGDGHVHTGHGAVSHTHVPDAHTHGVGHEHDRAALALAAPARPTHVHAPAADAEPARRHSGRTAGIGVASGLTPSPTALLVLLGAHAAGHAGVGVAAVVAFSAGMALTLTLVGVLVVRTGDGLLRRAARQGTTHRLASLAPRFAAAAVVVAGGVLTLRGLGQVVG
ncbi:hypothetical protein ACWFNE_16835 [Cellulomonas sp. NPDC055163]